MKKSLVLAMAMALGVTASAYAANPFSDVPAGHWAYDSVNKLAAAGVVDGYPDGTYGGDKLMTRYEMAQIVAKAMAKGANVDKLAAEFADELDTLGVRVATLEEKADNVKISGEIRARYRSYENSKDKSDLRTRLWVTGQVNDDWSYTGMIENEQEFAHSNEGEEDFFLQRAYLKGRLGGLDVKAGRIKEDPFTGNIYDGLMDGIKVSYGKDIEVFGIASKATEDESGTLNSSDRLYIVGAEAKIDNTKLFAGYYTANNADTGVKKADYADKDIWNVGITHKFNNFKLTGEYMRGDKEHFDGAGKDGWFAELAYKGAKASKVNSYGMHARYYDQSVNAYILPTTDAEFFDDGYKGWNVGFDYTLAKNIVLEVDYYDTEAQTTNEDEQLLYSALYFTF